MRYSYKKKSITPLLFAYICLSSSSQCGPTDQETPKVSTVGAVGAPAVDPSAPVASAHLAKKEASGTKEDEVKQEDKDAESSADEAGPQQEAAENKTDEEQSGTDDVQKEEDINTIPLAEQSQQIYDCLVKLRSKIESIYKGNPHTAPDCQSDVAKASGYVEQLHVLLTKAKQAKLVCNEVKIIECHLKDSANQLAQLEDLIKAQTELPSKPKPVLGYFEKLGEFRGASNYQSNTQKACEEAYVRAKASFVALDSLDQVILEEFTVESELRGELVKMFEDVAKAIIEAETYTQYPALVQLNNTYYAVDQAAKLVQETRSSVRSLRIRSKIDPFKTYSPQFRTVLGNLDLVFEAIHLLLVNDCKAAYVMIVNALNTNDCNVNASVSALTAVRHAYEVLAAVYRACAAAVKGTAPEVEKEVKNVESYTSTTRSYANEAISHVKHVIKFGPLSQPK